MNRARSTETLTPSGVDLSLRSFLRHFADEVLRLDARVWRTVGTLLRRPGHIARLFVSGQADSYVHPARLYLVVNVAFFLLVPFFNTSVGTIWRFDSEILGSLAPAYAQRLTNEAAALEMDKATYQHLFDAQIRNTQGVFVAVLLPIFAALLWACFRGRRRYFVEHLVFSTALYSVFLITLLAFGLFSRGILMVVSDPFAPLPGLIMLGALVAWSIYLMVWVVRGLGAFYGLKRVSSLLAGLVFFTLFVCTFYIYAHVLFWTSSLSLMAALG